MTTSALLAVLVTGVASKSRFYLTKDLKTLVEVEDRGVRADGLGTGKRTYSDYQDGGEAPPPAPADEPAPPAEDPASAPPEAPAQPEAPASDAGSLPGKTPLGSTNKGLLPTSGKKVATTAASPIGSSAKAVGQQKTTPGLAPRRPPVQLDTRPVEKGDPVKAIGNIVAMVNSGKDWLRQEAEQVSEDTKRLQQG